MDLTPDERDFFRDAAPAGLILFARNCETPEQVAALTAAFRACVGRDDALVLVDQEGGRVQRMRPPHWRRYPCAATFAALAGASLDSATQTARLISQLLARELRQNGITMNCTPVLDRPVRGADGIIGDRAFGSDVEIITALGRAVIEGHMREGVCPVIKHIPGHGRATADSHLALAVITEDPGELDATDFAPFRALSHAPAAMTAHVVLDQVDPDNPATTSPAVVRGIIREKIGFDGLLMSDDLSMNALSGGIAERAKQAIAAGCDLALHCNGHLDEMAAIAAAIPELSGAGERRLAAAHITPDCDTPFDPAKAEAVLAELVR